MRVNSDGTVEPDLDLFLKAIQRQETGGLPNGGENAVGDGGRSIGPLQISREAHFDAMEGLPESERFPYRDCNRLAPSIRVAKLYWQRYCPAALRYNQWSVLARIWNGGPKGNEKESTIKYWLGVKSHLADLVAEAKRELERGDTDSVQTAPDQAVAPKPVIQLVPDREVSMNSKWLSRKWLLGIFGTLSGILNLVFGVPTDQTSDLGDQIVTAVEAVASAGLAAWSVWSFIRGEAEVDAARLLGRVVE